MRHGVVAGEVAGRRPHPGVRGVSRGDQPGRIGGNGCGRKVGLEEVVHHHARLPVAPLGLGRQLAVPRLDAVLLQRDGARHLNKMKQNSFRGDQVR